MAWPRKFWPFGLISLVGLLLVLAMFALGLTGIILLLVPGAGQASGQFLLMAVAILMPAAFCEAITQLHDKTFDRQPQTAALEEPEKPGDNARL